jgi:hypothetical protein
MRRSKHLLQQKHAVFMEQARQVMSNERNEELLALQASTASRRARSFATLLGQADAWVVHKEEEQGDSPTPFNCDDVDDSDQEIPADILSILASSITDPSASVADDDNPAARENDF